MENEEMFRGFVVAADQDRFGERVSLLDEPHDCKVSAKDTGGAMCAFEHTGRSSGPRRFHHEQDAWIYVLGGTVEAQVGDERFRIGAGESAFVPRKVGFAWATPDGGFAKILTVFQPAGTMEEFFREVGSFDSPIHEVLGIPGLKRLFSEHGMTIVGPPLFYNEPAS